MRVVQLTDLHLLDDPNGELRAVPLRQAFVEVWQEVLRDYGEADLFVFTGDLVHDAGKPAYRQLRDIVADVLPRCRFLLGNHDDPLAFRSVFGDQVTPAGPVGFQEEVASWRVVGLDTQVLGAVPGRAGEEQLASLATALRRGSNRPTLVLQHHPPDVGPEDAERPWLEDTASFRALLRDFPAIRIVAAGHLHYEMASQLEGAMVVTTPSTCVQFEPGTFPIASDAVPAGFRVFDLLDDGGFATRVVRQRDLRFPPERIRER